MDEGGADQYASLTLVAQSIFLAVSHKYVINAFVIVYGDITINSSFNKNIEFSNKGLFSKKFPVQIWIIRKT